MNEEKLKKILFVLIMLKNKETDEKKKEYLDEAIGYAEEMLGVGCL